MAYRRNLENFWKTFFFKEGTIVRVKKTKEYAKILHVYPLSLPEGKNLLFDVRIWDKIKGDWSKTTFSFWIEELEP